MYGYPLRFKRWTRSRTIIWGHIQNVLGLALVVLPFITQANFPDLPPYVYGGCLVAFGVITYILRKLTDTSLK